MNIDEKGWRQVADAYLEEYAAGLRQELEDLDQLEAMPTPGLDRRVRSYVAGAKRSRSIRWIGGLAAACLLVALLTPAVWRSNPSVQPAPSMPQPPPASSSATAAPAFEVLPLTFALPDQFTVGSVEQDLEKTVYTLENELLDPVVMTLEQKGDTAFFAELTPITLDGQRVFGRSDGGYNLLAFEKQDIVYILTCRYDINTLADLSHSILL